MRKFSGSRTGLKTAVVVALAGSASAHSWVEHAYKIAPNGTMVGAEGYPRGWIPRNSTDPLWNDSIPQLLLPVPGQSAYSGNEILNKFPKEENPKFPRLEAAAGDSIAIIHLENGHTTLPQNQPKKPKNRGTIYLYGTSDPKEKERLFDVHLVWNRDGTGGDRRGRLLSTRNYDDGQCYQPNSGPISLQRATELAIDGAVHGTELACQSDIRLPDDLKPGSIYTIYWYWDWPDLDPEHISFDTTTNGVFPWAGTFMRGEKDPHGFTMAAIARNESYASTIDIKIMGDKSQSFAAKGGVNMNQWVSKQNIYSKAIKEQIENDYQVDIDANGGSGNHGGSRPPTSATPDVPVSTTAAPGNPTVTLTVTVAPSTVWKTIYTTVPVESMPSSTEKLSTSTHSESPTPQPTSTVIKTVTLHVPAAGPTTSFVRPTGRPAVTPFQPLRRRNWGFGGH